MSNSSVTSRQGVPDGIESLGALRKIYEDEPGYWKPLLILGVIGLVFGIVVTIVGLIFAPAGQKLYALLCGGGFLVAFGVLLALALSHRHLRVYLCDGGFAHQFLGKIKLYSWEDFASTRSVAIASKLGNKHFLKSKERGSMVLSTEVHDVDELAGAIEQAVCDHLRPEIEEALEAGETVDFNDFHLTREGVLAKGGFVGRKKIPWSEIRSIDIRNAPAQPVTLLVLEGEDGKPLSAATLAMTPNPRLLLEQIKARANLR